MTITNAKSISLLLAAVVVGLVRVSSLYAGEESWKDETALNVKKTTILEDATAAVLRVETPKLPDALPRFTVKAVVEVAMKDGSKKEYTKEVEIDVRSKTANVEGVAMQDGAALDERVTVAVPSCSFTSYTSAAGFVFHCDCCLVPRVQVELGDMADVGALSAPRSLLAVHGRKDGLHCFADVEAAMARVHSIYSAAGASDGFRHKWGAAGHKFYPDIMWPFIESALVLHSR